MLNRRSALVNLVTLTVTSNVSSTITIDGQVFSGVTTASVKVRQGKEISWSVSASGYDSKNGSVLMNGDKTQAVSLDASTVTFTINTNVSATITINGDISTGVTSKSMVVNANSSVSWSVSAAEYTTQSGTESNVTSEVTKNVTLVFNGVTSICKSGYIWCTDGSFVAPSRYKASGKKAYGYALSNNVVARLTKSSIYMVWAPDNSPFYNSTGVQSTYGGVDNSNILKSKGGFNSTNCPAVYYACTQTNGGRTSYMPSMNELSALYRSIMSGNMKTDLTTAGLYESCYYRFANSGGWGDVWSSSEYSSTDVWVIRCDGFQGSERKNSVSDVIPFFHFD